MLLDDNAAHGHDDTLAGHLDSGIQLEVVAVGKCEMVALSLGERGAVLIARDRILSVASPAVDIQSAVGAGGSFAGAITLVLTRKQDLGEPEVLIVQPPS